MVEREGEKGGEDGAPGFPKIYNKEIRASPASPSEEEMVQHQSKLGIFYFSFRTT